MIFQQTIIKGKYGTLLSKAAVPFIQCQYNFYAKIHIIGQIEYELGQIYKN